MTLLFALLACTGNDPQDSETRDSETQDTESQDSGSDDTGETGDTGEVPAVLVTQDGESRSFRVDGTSSEVWIYVDFELGQVSEDASWDVRVQRSTLEASADAQVAWQPSEDFGSLSAPIAGLPWDGRLDTWYSYDSTTHVLAPLPGVYAIDRGGQSYLLEMLDYYHPDTGSSGHPQFRVKAVDPAPPSKVTHSNASGIRNTQVDARDGTVTLRLASGAPASTANPELWDLSFDRFNVLEEGVTVEILEGVEFTSLTSTPSDAAFQDTLSEWYDYDGQTHTLSPKEQVYVVRAGIDYKLQFFDYYAEGEGGFVSFQWAPLELGL